MKTYLGLRQQIAKATSITEIDALLKSCEEKPEASDKTKRAWINTAKRRVKQLQTLPPEKTKNKSKKATKTAKKS